jgi:YggT family protein
MGSIIVQIVLRIIIALALYGIDALIIAMLIRVFASWFQFDERFAFIRFLARLTDPFIVPIRRIVRPAAGMFDFSFLIAWFLLLTIQTLLLQALPLNPSLPLNP